MKTRSDSAFTLIEMLTVMAIIAVIASLIVAVAGMVNQKAARSRAEGEIQSLSTAMESYKADNGTYPQSGDTDALDPRVDLIATDKKYKQASRDLYKDLSGDREPDGEPDFKPEDKNKVYFPFRPDQLKVDKDSAGKIIKVEYIQDPFGQSYGYSTAAAKAEAEYRDELRKNPGTPRPTKTPGYNGATFDLWTTGGMSSISKTKEGEPDQTRWVKNW